MAPSAAAPEWMDYLRSIMALVFVCGLIVLLAFALRRTGLDKKIIGNKGAARLRIIETLYLSPKHRLVMVRHDEKEHLLLLGSSGDLLIDSQVKGAADAQ